MNIGTWKVPFEAYCGNDPYAFVSYAHRDHDLVFQLLNGLYGKDYRLWYDEGIDPGNEWAEEVARALNQCQFFLVFISPRSVGSRNVRNEINFALNHNKPFLAVHLEPTELPPGLELRISNIQAVMHYRMDSSSSYRKIQQVLDMHQIQEEPTLLSDTAPVEGLAEPLESAPSQYYDELAQAQRTGDMVKVRQLGAQVAKVILERVLDVRATFHEGIMLMNIAVILDDANQFILAKRCFHAFAEYLLSFCEKHGESVKALDYLGMAYNNLGRLIRKRNPKSRQAETYYRKSMEVFECLYPNLSDNMNLGDRLGMSYLNLGNSLVVQGKRQAALQCYSDAVNIYEKLLSQHPGNTHLGGRLQESRDNAARIEKGGHRALSD